jgi:hypothetical protein
LKAVNLGADASFPGYSGLMHLCGGMAGIVAGAAWAWAPAAATASEAASDVAQKRREIIEGLDGGRQKSASYAATSAGGRARANQRLPATLGIESDR